jgi:hypothetical protein
MAVRALRYASGAHLEDMAYLIAHLKADPQAAELASNVEVSAAALKTQTETWSSNRHAVEEAQTRLENVDENLHDVVRTARDVILQDVHHSRRSPKFLTYFPRGLAAIFRTPYADQLRVVRSLAERCAQDPSPKIQDQVGLLTAAADQMHAAYEQRLDALVAESASYGQLQVQKIESIRMRRRVGHRLAELYPDDRDRVRSCFRLVYRRRRAKDVAPEGAMPAIEMGTEAATAAAGTTAAPVLRLASGFPARGGPERQAPREL